jgi:Family of unknown function (DUF5681)
MSEVKRDYEIGYGKPPRGRPFQKGQSGNPRGPRRKDLSSLLIAALNEPVYATIDGKRRKITKRQAIVTQMVNESAGANLRATKMLFDMLKEVEQKAGGAAPPEPAKLTATDREVVDLFVARLRGQIAAEAAAAPDAAAANRPADHVGPDRRRGHRVGRVRGAVARRLRELCRVLLSRTQPAHPLRDELACRGHA